MTDSLAKSALSPRARCAAMSPHRRSTSCDHHELSINIAKFDVRFDSTIVLTPRDDAH